MSLSFFQAGYIKDALQMSLRKSFPYTWEQISLNYDQIQNVYNHYILALKSGVGTTPTGNLSGGELNSDGYKIASYIQKATGYRIDSIVYMIRVMNYAAGVGKIPAKTINPFEAAAVQQEVKKALPATQDKTPIEEAAKWGKILILSGALGAGAFFLSKLNNLIK